MLLCYLRDATTITLGTEIGYRLFPIVPDARTIAVKKLETWFFVHKQHVCKLVIAVRHETRWQKWSNVIATTFLEFIEEIGRPIPFTRDLLRIREQRS